VFQSLARLCLVPALAVGLLAGGTVVAGAGALATVPVHQQVSSPPIVDGFVVGWLPRSLVGDNVSDFTYSFDDVDFQSKVWESGPDGSGAYHVDLDVGVLRGDVLSNPAALYQFLTDYEQRPADEWHFVPFSVHGHPGYLGRDEAFWLVRPGLAVRISVNRDRFSVADVVMVADGIHQETIT
jgi:hypothetical protein